MAVMHAEVMPAPLAMAWRLAPLPIKGLVESRRFIDTALPRDFGDAITLAVNARHSWAHAAKSAKAVTPFIVKRPPIFKDR